MPKLFVLDTSVLLFDHNAITHFEEHNIVLPITVLEELDRFKIGNETKNYEAREVIRYLDQLSTKNEINQWISLGKGKGKLKVVMHEPKHDIDADEVYGEWKNDHKIINVALGLKAKHSRTQVVLVTKDINLRVKARALGLVSEDYLTGKVTDMESIEESSMVLNNLDASIISSLYQDRKVKENGILKDLKSANGYYILHNCSDSALARYNSQDDTIERVEKKYAYGIKPKNAGQTFAMDALFNDDIKLIALQGVAGSGKTLLALASALEQRNKYDQIILTRPIIPLSNRDIGFLPGDADDKISPYMQPLWDNLKFIKSQYREKSKKASLLDELQDEGILEITALAYIRGRSLVNTMFIVDEAQNLTPHEIKTIITRAGEGTKIVFTGDVNQIDTPYMDEKSNGLTYIIDRLKGNHLFAHIKLEKGERSELANLANQLL